MGKWLVQSTFHFEILINLATVHDLDECNDNYNNLMKLMWIKIKIPTVNVNIYSLPYYSYNSC